MTPREQRLRQRIDQLTDERDTLRGDIRALKRRKQRRCVLCGFPANGRLCHAHSDLALSIPSSAGGSAPREAGTRTKEPAGRLIRRPLPVTSIAGTSLQTEERNEQ